MTAVRPHYNDRFETVKFLTASKKPLNVIERLIEKQTFKKSFEKKIPTWDVLMSFGKIVTVFDCLINN